MKKLMICDAIMDMVNPTIGAWNRNVFSAKREKNKNG